MAFFVMQNRRWKESDTCRGDDGRRGNLARVSAGPPREAQQVWEILVLVLLVSGGRGQTTGCVQGDGGSSLGRNPKHPTREAYLESHGEYIRACLLCYRTYSCYLFLV